MEADQRGTSGYRATGIASAAPRSHVTNASTFKPKQDYGFKIAQLKVKQCGQTVPPAGTGCSNLPPGMAMPYTLPEYPISGLAAAGK